MFESVLVANRGEIACRVIRTLGELGIRSIAVYTDADRGARHVGLADRAVHVDSYLDAAALVTVATATGADAVHPGYGFLAENADFARACAAAGVVFIGPPPQAIETMGDKIRAKAHVAARGVPIIPGTGDAGMTDAQLIEAASGVGLPLIVKPSAGGGGKGMTVVDSLGELPAVLAASRRVAKRAFGDDALLLERYIPSPRHIEVQVLADTHGTVMHLGERECSLQRRHQKVIEESPSPLLSDTTRAAIGEAAREVARSVAYVGAGTVEFLVSDAEPDTFFFMEMNTRLQVEHPVTEMVAGVDLVEWQLRIAAGERLELEFAPRGHAIEARLCAEDPAAGFLPTGGTVLGLREADGVGVRVDSALAEGLVVTSDYDSLLAKVIAWGETRDKALARLDRALAETTVLGVRTNQAFLRDLLADPRVRAGRLDTGLVDALPTAPQATDAAALACAALIEHATAWGPSLWGRPSGWRIGAHRPARYHLGDSTVTVLGAPGVAVVDGLPTRFRHDESTATIEFGGESVTFRWARAGGILWLARDGRTWELPVLTREQRLAAHRASLARVEGVVNPEVRASMPGTVVSVFVASGDAVAAGQPLLAVEAMKMEHALAAPSDGVVTVAVAPGDQVRLDQLVATVTP
ncbi:biotin carboxylase N-terminal domain-containing protein [Leifsonia sp. H3M29-4]|uniref:ATP-binding protein n=1 Tax=Salinibacterium metalliresistens TaxID=3031321 RepID=UPI0023DB7209|nr:biotin carboxylase N-terminal domain-containing protein [Salinibacterium metalliresistens]MDF1479388.1 biotin carboxylase N-terminal domain-containing protein [Salinibacterium metalliresistens]